MSKDNKDKLKARDKAHRQPQQRKYINRAFIVYMLLMTILFSLLLIPSCQQAKEQGVTYEQRGGNHE
ncbi:hypothetical protein [Psychrobacter immobilis]|uniref:hypothetical protein n=1 Tax=Psychrobacter immobilis TaxID=498 RepID=UPI00191A24BD|nr:hypothetical protein [Psychrobacter immobilis]